MAKEKVFSDFQKVVQEQFNRMANEGLFVVDVEKDVMWDTYLSSFPEGSNPMFRERTEHDCQCCKSFIRSIGNVVSIIDGNIESIWDVEVGGHYQPVADAMAELIRSKPIENIFLSVEKSKGAVKTHSLTPDGHSEVWNHFFVQIPNNFVVDFEDKGTKLSEARSTRDVFKRGLEEITMDAVDTVLDLISQGSLYRGDEKKKVLERFKTQMEDWDNSDLDIDMFSWERSRSVHVSVCRIRNDVVGTLLTDLSNSVDLEHSVKSFEDKMSGSNYKRTTALVTDAMKKKALKRFVELGFEDSADRRYAVARDITINNVLHANRKTRAAMSALEEAMGKIPEKPKSAKNMEKVEEVGVDAFIENILPNAESIELMFENSHVKNLMSLIAPVDSDSKSMFKWGNGFSWAYNGDVTDSIKDRVKSAGGKVDGDLRCSLSWFNYDDLDLHMMEPGGEHIYFSHKKSRDTGGNLDVDMNAGGRDSRNPVENICYPDKRRMKEGVYKLYVNQYSKRESEDVGFDVEIEFDGVIHSFSYPKSVRNDRNITVAEFEYTHANGIEFKKKLPSSATSKVEWGIPTHQFHKVTMVMNSPNFWDDKAIGNKHYFFILDKCLQEGSARGFFNEFLVDDLRDDRKVFEILGANMKTKESDDQLSGLGFSSTQRNSVLCKVEGSFTRVIKINF